MENPFTAIIKAADFAAVKHKDQKRKDGVTPYINHPIGVANFITELGGINDPVVLQAALLHDTVEDTETTLDEIEEVFGPKVRQVVAEVTDDKTLSNSERKQRQLEGASSLSYEARLVRLADKLYNLQDVDRLSPLNWTADYRDYYIKWCREIVDKIRGTNAGLESALDRTFSKHAHLFQK